MSGGEDLQQVLSIPRGTVRCFAGATLADLRLAARDPVATGLAVALNGRRVLLHAVEPHLSPQAAFDRILQALADAAGALFPRWYDRRPGLPRRAEAIPDAASLAADAAACGASPTWLARAVERARTGRPPLPARVAAVETARQLGLVLAPEGLCVVLVVGDEGAEPASVLAHLAPWLADGCGWSVGLLFAEEMPQDAAFDRIRHGLVRLRAAAEPRDTVSEAVAPAPPWEAPLSPPRGVGHRSERGWLWPLTGHPHPLSPAELRLARLLDADTHLKDLFAFNMPVRTRAGSTFLVDLLWEAGRLVVEVDGYGPHSSRAAFARDRHRDYELAASRYRVLRLTHDEVMMPGTLALEKIRTLIALAPGAAPMKEKMHGL